MLHRIRILMVFIVVSFVFCFIGAISGGNSKTYGAKELAIQVYSKNLAKNTIYPSLQEEREFAPGGKLKSGAIRKLPWERGESFLNALGKMESPVLLGAYRTVLKDPLPGEEYNVHLAAEMLAGKMIQPGQVFSQNGTAGPYITERGFRKGPTYIGSQLTTTIGGGVCKIASTLYNVTILSNLPVVERHAHSMPVPYVPYGQDATVAYGARDFKFMNNTDAPVMIWAQGIDNVLYMAFYGKYPPPVIEWHHETLEMRKAEKIYKINRDLPKGSEKLALEGMDGATVKSWITIKRQDGSVETKNLGISYYRPMAHVIERGE